ncbi:MAG: hypothetical protein HZY76_02720 [Anaerolineae bacterium]|nr:MAG: hypothetical protein HZY76_02720 [Anaerolineae bacterium]
MKVSLNVTGGPLPYGEHGQIDVADLPDDLARRVTASLRPTNMRKAISAQRAPARRTGVRLVVTDPSGKRARHATSLPNHRPHQT